MSICLPDLSIRIHDLHNQSHGCHHSYYHYCFSSWFVARTYHGIDSDSHHRPAHKIVITASTASSAALSATKGFIITFLADTVEVSLPMTLPGSQLGLSGSNRIVTMAVIGVVNY